MHGVPYPGDDKMKMYFTEKEDLEGKDYINSFTKAKGKPVVLIQCYGGRLTWNGNSMTDNKNWFPEYWEKLVQRLTKDFYVIQIGGPQEQQVPGCNFYMLPGCNMRQSAALLRHCLSYITIDSYANHAGPASRSNWGGVVLFGRSNPLIAGHRKNRNIWINESCDFEIGDHGLAQQKVA
jgi:ADP-heptose:LPS heptosyltransferase